MKLTPKVAAQLASAPSGREIIFDDELPGFGLRRGSRWVFQYEFGSKSRRITFGRYPAIDVAKARAIAADLHAQVRLGQDPQGAKVDARARAGETFGACVERFLPWQQRRVRASSYKEVVRHLSRNLAALHGLNIAAVDKRAIATQLTRLTAVCGPTQANRTRASLCKFLDWCCREGLIETNPATFTNVNEERSRDRVLDDGEIFQIWNNLPDSDYGIIVKLLILTGQRRDEIAALRWSEVDFASGEIRLPGERTKNHRAHVVPLSPLAVALLEVQLVRHGGDFAFGRGRRGFNGIAKCKAALDSIVALPPWRTHDLRRAAATGMAELGVQPHIIEAVLNHVSGAKAGVAGIYNRASYEGEKRAALTLWADHVVALVEGRQRKVVPLRREPA